MRPTIPWMQQAFGFYNKKYFGGRLKTPKFSLDCPYGNWGFYTPNGTFNRVTRRATIFGPGTLSLTSKYSRDEKDLIGTLLHEMIHMYINTVMKLYPRNPHGEEFYGIANRINQDGWNISESNEMMDDDIYDENGDESSQTNNDTSYILCILEQPSHGVCKYWGFKADETTLDGFVSTCRSLKAHGATKLNIYQCYNSALERLPSSHEQLLGVGANNINMLLRYLSQLSGGNISLNNLKLINEIQL
jgi:hypothetical protein